MDFYLQFGYGMMEHCRHLIQSWGGGCVILSPRDLEEPQLKRLGGEIVDLGGTTLIDPQLYNPRANHHRLIQHEYWPSEYNTGILSGGTVLENILYELKELNNKAQTDKYILPSIICETVGDDWLAVQNSILSSSSNILDDKPLLSTICLSADSLRAEAQIENLIDCTAEWPISGCYIVPEHGMYLVDDPLWMANLLSLCSGLKLQNKEVVVGYCSHQMTCLAAANIDAIASGTWLNVRAFNRNKFTETDDDSTSRRTTWYYCSPSLSEYKIPFLDMAFKAGILNRMELAGQSNAYSNMLFSGAQPSATDYSESSSFRHYLTSLRNQVIESRKNTFRQTVDFQNSLLDSAEQMINLLQQNGVRGQDRDFKNIVDVNRAALQDLVNSRGFILDRTW